MIVFCGGIIGYARKGSTTSLAGGVGTGLLLFFASYLTLNAFHKRKNSWFGLILETVIAAALTWVMGQRYSETAKIMPAGVVAGISGVMTAFYLYKIATGGNHISAKAE